MNIDYLLLSRVNESLKCRLATMIFLGDIDEIDIYSYIGSK